MRFDNIFIPKGNGLGWTLNFDNPLSKWLLIAFILVILFICRNPLMDLVRSIKGFITPPDKE